MLRSLWPVPYAVGQADDLSLTVRPVTWNPELQLAEEGVSLLRYIREFLFDVDCYDERQIQISIARSFGFCRRLNRLDDVHRSDAEAAYPYRPTSRRTSRTTRDRSDDDRPAVVFVPQFLAGTPFPDLCFNSIGIQRCKPSSNAMAQILARHVGSWAPFNVQVEDEIRTRHVINRTQYFGFSPFRCQFGIAELTREGSFNVECLRSAGTHPEVRSPAIAIRHLRVYVNRPAHSQETRVKEQFERGRGKLDV
ncbi:hypothetical protein WS95_13420 [Burkholderia sp. MSMB1826]|nr:hypothetical protein WS95_13420 [Burkholderia sp. MSMB1826]